MDERDKRRVGEQVEPGGRPKTWGGSGALPTLQLFFMLLRLVLLGKAFIETFALIGALSAVTTKLHFNIFVLKLPIRPPALVAKQAGSLAALFDNRIGLGVGTSPWPEDYEIMGVPFAKRGKRMDECIDVIRGLTSGDYFEYHGEFYDIPKVKMTPAPTKPVPILIGGHADAALRRAARNDGWMHGGGDPGGTRPDSSTGSRSSARKRAIGRPVRDPRDLARRVTRRTVSSGSRTRASPTSWSVSASPTSWARTPSRSTTRSATSSGSRRTSSRRCDRGLDRRRATPFRSGPRATDHSDAARSTPRALRGRSTFLVGPTRPPKPRGP